MSQEVSDQDLREAIDRIARTADGGILYLYLQKTLCGVASDDSERALQADHGRRRFAQQLMGLMSEGVSVNGRSGSVTFTVASRDPRPDRKPGARLVGPGSFVPGFSDPAREPPGK